MAILGSTSQPQGWYEWSGPNSNEQVASARTFPGGGPWRVTRVGIWVAGKGAAADFRCVVWSNDRNTVLGQSATFSVAARTMASGNGANYERDLATPFVVNGGETVYAGWWRKQDDVGWWPGATGGQHYDDTETGGAPAPMSGEVSDTDHAVIGAYLYYELDNTAPGAPTNVSLDGAASGSVLVGSDANWLLAFTGNDPGDVLASYAYQIDTTSGNGAEPDWASLVADVSGQTGGINGQSVSQVIAHSLNRGQWYALRVRTTDDGGLTGAWSSTYYFKVNSLPTIGTRTPGAGALAFVHNLGTDLAVWTLGGSHAKPRLRFVYQDADGQQSQSFRLRIYAASAGGSPLWDTGTVAYAIAAGSEFSADAGYALVLGTEYWWTVEVVDSLGESSGESSRTAFKVRWGQGIYEYNPGPSSSGWRFSAAGFTNGYGAFLYATASATGGTGRSAWATDIGTLNSRQHTPSDTWLNVLVRLAPNAAGTNVTLPDMTFTYIGGATTPDRWVAAGGATILLDLSVRRYGSQSLKVTTAASTSYVRPYTYPGGVQADIPVVGNVRYTWSLFVKTLGALTTGVRLAVYQAGTATYLLDGATGQNVVGGLVTDSSGDVDGWRRLTLTFVVPTGVSFIRPVIEYAGATAGQVFWIDAGQQEEGAVASQWRPGLIGDAFVADSNGMMIDASAGGIMRLRASTGGTRDQIELGTNGLLFGGDTQLYSPATGIIRAASFRAEQSVVRGVGTSPQAAVGDANSANKWAKIASGNLYGQYAVNQLAGRILTRYDDIEYGLRMSSDGSWPGQPSNVTLTSVNHSFAPTIKRTDLVLVVTSADANGIVWELWVRTANGWVDIWHYPDSLVDPWNLAAFYWGGSFQTSLPSGTQYAGTGRHPGEELAYGENATSNGSLTVTATTGATAQEICSTGARDYEGVPVVISVYAPRFAPGSALGAWLQGCLYIDGSLGPLLGDIQNPAAQVFEMPYNASLRKTLSAGSHTLSFRVYRGGADGTINFGDGSNGAFPPAYIRVTRA